MRLRYLLAARHLGPGRLSVVARGRPYRDHIDTSAMFPGFRYSWRQLVGGREYGNYVLTDPEQTSLIEFFGGPLPLRRAFVYEQSSGGEIRTPNGLDMFTGDSFAQFLNGAAARRSLDRHLLCCISLRRGIKFSVNETGKIPAGFEAVDEMFTWHGSHGTYHCVMRAPIIAEIWEKVAIALPPFDTFACQEQVL